MKKKIDEVTLAELLKLKNILQCAQPQVNDNIKEGYLDFAHYSVSHYNQDEYTYSFRNATRTKENIPLHKPDGWIKPSHQINGYLYP